MHIDGSRMSQLDRAELAQQGALRADGLRAADPDARLLLRSLHATRWQSLRFLEAPAALPAAFTGLKVAAAVAKPR